MCLCIYSSYMITIVVPMTSLGGIFRRMLERRTILYRYATLFALSVRTLWQSTIYYFFVRFQRSYQWCVCVSSSPWWSRPSWTLIIHTLGLFKLILYTKAFSCIKTLYKICPKWLRHFSHIWYEIIKYIYKDFFKSRVNIWFDMLIL